MIHPTSITHFLEQLSSFFHGDNPTSQTSKPPKPPNLQTSKPQNHQNLEKFPPPGSATVKGPRHTLLLSTVDGLPRSPPSYSTARGTRHPENPLSVISQPLEGQHLSKLVTKGIFRTNALLRIIPT
eukprot:TRINITY_DN1437_c0_g1_i14.p1 TRINITY_DN1437_c0_g1~~TRINITY_DN1437_c0_g1_i14.p1  ORF type:complete len:126 (+),score=16.43 TRINITY_DN1437_c0_g1_i14:1057-1434(+)